MTFPTPDDLVQYYVDPQRFFDAATQSYEPPNLQEGLEDPFHGASTVRVSQWYLLDTAAEDHVLGEITAVIDRDSTLEIHARMQSDSLFEIKYTVAAKKQIRIGCRTYHIGEGAPSPELPHDALVAIPQAPIGMTRVIGEEERLLLDAIKTVTGERQDQYGNPEDSLAVIASYWNAYLHSKGDVDVRISSVDAGMMMILLKVAREANKPKRDNLLDIAGYAAITSRAVRQS